MSFFDDVLHNAKKVEDDILGPDYEYWKQIRTPKQLGMSSKGSIKAISRDVAGLIDYTEVLVSGRGRASATGGPLGNKFFLKTGAKCKDKTTKKLVDRYAYINNVPDGGIPFISSAMGGASFSTFEGLVPGALGNLGAMNPMTIFQAFMTGSNPECQELTMETIDANNNRGKETQFVTLIDIKNMNPCSFSNNRNPVTKQGCVEAFDNNNSDASAKKMDKSKLPNDVFVQLFYASLGLLGLYILMNIVRKSKK